MTKTPRSELHNAHSIALKFTGRKADGLIFLGHFGEQARTKTFTSLESLKKAIVREWAKIPGNLIRAACDSFLDRLKVIVKAKDGHIEQK